METILQDEFTEKCIVMRFRVFKKDHPDGPKHETLRVLVLGRNQRKRPRATSWTGLLLDSPRFARVKRGDFILVRERDLKDARPMTYPELAAVLALYHKVAHRFIPGGNA